jgi:hypothetical protein
MSQMRILSTPPAAPVWTDRIGPSGWRNWDRIEQLLLSGGRWQQPQLDSLAAESLRVLRHLRDPLANKTFRGRGLVVGYVQSGKTANYTAVAARAADAGYRLFIILSGIHDALRNQTQARLELELVGVDEKGNVPAGWTLLTSRNSDFAASDHQILSEPGAFLLVVKKNTRILDRLIKFLKGAKSELAGLPALIIDDEADQASINTGSNRATDPSLENGEDSEDQESAPSRTNAKIRSLLGVLPRASYIAYTATPFANIFINPQAMDREVGEDLFPRDFALQLPRPEGYTGTEELFGVSAQGRDILRHVSDHDVSQLRRRQGKRNMGLVIGPPVSAVPGSLSQAFLTFCLAGAVRDLRPGLYGQPHTMLVHVSARTDDQARIAGALREQREIWAGAIRQGQRPDDIFAPILAAHLSGVELSAAPKAVFERAGEVLAGLDILELNSVAGENLAYESRTARHLVAVGGNRLSRGLTLEGLTVSYFLRTTSMADTLLQMARWYGFRTGYEDLIRIWTTEGIAHWFSELALVEQSLRDALQALARAGRRPEEMAIRLRAHSGLLLTARNKAGLSSEVRDSWSGEHPQTVMLPLRNIDRLQENRLVAERLVSAAGTGRSTAGGLLFQDIVPELICEFLRLYRTHDDVIAFRGAELAEWIEERVAAGELTEWSIFIAGSEKGADIRLGGHRTGVVTRSRISRDSIGILIDPRHEGVDLPGGPDAYRRRNGDYDAGAMRAARPSSEALLILYPLDPGPLDVLVTDAVIAVALSLPTTSDGTRMSVVNLGIDNG